MLWIIPVILISGFALSGPIMSDVEQARFTVINTDGDYEVREYAPSIVAETKVSGERKEAIGAGFRAIADYIFGNNITNDKVAMTAPVIQEANESNQTIAMTAPVSQVASKDGWTIRFVMPAEYSMETLPKPNNTQVHIIPMPSKKVVAVQFTGSADDDLLHEKEEDLRNYMKDHDMKPIGTAIYAFYNPPWTLPFLRHNEVMLEIKE